MFIKNIDNIVRESLHTEQNVYKKILANIEQVKARKGITIVFTDKRSEEIERLSNYLIVIPSMHDHIFPILGRRFVSRWMMFAVF